MPEPSDYLHYARDCKRLALQPGGQEDRELLLEMAKAWTDLAVEKSIPDAPDRSEPIRAA